MAPPIQLNQFYQVQQAQLKASDLQTGEQSLLTLFSESCFDIQVKNLLELFALSEQKFSFYVEQKSATFYWSVYADYSSLLTLKKQLTESHFDYLLWPEKVVEPPRLLLFDMDSTFIEIEVIDELANYHNVGEEVSRVTEAAMRGELDFSESLISRVACLKGLEQSAIDLIAAKLPLSKGVVELVNYAKKNGCVSAIVSGGFTPFVGKLKVDLDLYKVKANELELRDSKLTGKVSGSIVDAKAKQIFLLELCEELAITPQQVMAIGDGANDLLMMEAAGFNLAYRAKPKVQLQSNGIMNQTTLNRLVDIFGWRESY